MTENPKGTKSYGVKSLLFTFSFLEATNVLSFFCASQRQFISIQEEIMFILYICIFLLVCFPILIHMAVPRSCSVILETVPYPSLSSLFVLL